MFQSPGDVSPGLFRWCPSFERKLRKLRQERQDAKTAREEFDLILFLALLANLPALAQQKREISTNGNRRSCWRRDRGFAPRAFRNSFGSECRLCPCLNGLGR